MIGSDTDVRSLKLDVHVADEIAVASDGHGDTAGVSGRTVNGLLDVLHREIRMASVDSLEKCNLGVTSEIDILCAVGD
tara:strand:+ start:996 stop:1229 length:234 start_codon:yes stop_codon:yes gene_type:complete